MILSDWFYVFTLLLFTSHFRTGSGYHPAASHSNRTESRWKANLLFPRIFTLPFSEIRKQSVIINLNDVLFALFLFHIRLVDVLMYKCKWVGRNLSAPSSVSSEILLFGCTRLCYHLFSWAVHLQKMDFIRPRWLITCLQFSIAWRMLLLFFPLHRLPCQPNKPLKAPGDTVSHMWSLLSGRMKGGGGNTQLLQTER